MSPAKARKAAPKPPAKATKKAASRKGAKKATVAKPGKKAAVAPKSGRSGTAGKGEGDAAVAAWIAGIQPWQQALARRFDALAGATVPGVRRAVKWSAPFYGLPGQGWLATMAAFKQHMSIGFFAGTQLAPPPPAGDSGNMRRVVLHGEADYDEAQLRSWLQQATRLPGWGKV